MKSILIAALALLTAAQAPAPPAAIAVTGPAPGMLSVAAPPMPKAYKPSHLATGNAGLDQALALCDANQGLPVAAPAAASTSPRRPGGITPSWLPGYEACTQIVPLWALNVTLTLSEQAIVAAFLAAH